MDEDIPATTRTSKREGAKRNTRRAKLEEDNDEDVSHQSQSSMEGLYIVDICLCASFGHLTTAE